MVQLFRQMRNILILYRLDTSLALAEMDGWGE